MRIWRGYFGSLVNINTHKFVNINIHRFVDFLQCEDVEKLLQRSSKY